MSLLNTKFENAAKTLAESDDEVLQTAGLTALMRIETLKLRLRGMHGIKAITPQSNQPNFNFGIPPYNCSASNSIFGPQFFANASGFSRPGGGSLFGAAKPPTFASAPAGGFGQIQSVESSFSDDFGSSSQNVFSAPATTNSENFGNTTGLKFGIPSNEQTQLEKS